MSSLISSFSGGGFSGYTLDDAGAVSNPTTKSYTGRGIFVVNIGSNSSGQALIFGDTAQASVQQLIVDGIDLSSVDISNSLVPLLFGRESYFLDNNGMRTITMEIPYNVSLTLRLRNISYLHYVAN